MMSATPSTATDLDASFVIVDTDSKPKQQQSLSQVRVVLYSLQTTD